MPEPLRMVVVIVNRGKGEEVARFGHDNNIDYSFMAYGRGTLRGDMINLLGLGTVDKDVMACFIPRKDVRTHFAGLSGLLKLKHPGRGIAFSIPLSSLNALIARDVENAFAGDDNEGKEVRAVAPKFNLIIVVAEAGFAEPVMDAAKSAGATGGTLLHALGMGREEAETFMGTALQTEKEVVTILAEHNMAKEMMEAINSQCGLLTEAKGIVFSLPVDELVGIG